MTATPSPTTKKPTIATCHVEAGARTTIPSPTEVTTAPMRSIVGIPSRAVAASPTMRASSVAAR